MGALLVGRFAGGGDIRDEGSGNAGGTNALRTRGIAFALPVIVIDIGKGAVAATLVAGMPLPWPVAPVPGAVVALLCGGASVLGHVFPFWYGFRGGKGAATLVGVYAAVSPVLIAPLLLVWAMCLTLTGFVGLSTMVAAFSAALVVAMLSPGPAPQALLVFALAMALLVVFAHRDNVRRMLRGEEDQKRRVMLFRRAGGGS